MKQTIRLSFSGHYPEKYVEVSDEEFERLRSIQRDCGNLTIYQVKRIRPNDIEFVNSIWDREACGFKAPKTFVIYE